MSVSEPVSFGPSAGSSGGHDCRPDEDDFVPPAKVVVDGTQIPVINEGVRTEIRKDEAMAITRHSEVHFPAEWNGTNYADFITALDPSEANVYDPVDVYVKDHVTDVLKLVHRGFVMGAGGGSRGNLEHRFTVGDVGQLATALPPPPNAAYEKDAQLIEPVNDVIGVLQQALVPNIFSTIGFNANMSGPDQGDDLPGGGDDGGPPGPLPIGSATLGVISDALFDKPKTFHEDEHSAASVLRWVEERTNGHFYFEPLGEDGVTLVYDEDIENTGLAANHISPSNLGIEIYKNNALHEIRPLNTMTVTGAREDGQYPYVQVAHKPLLERANVPLQPKKQSVDTHRLRTTEVKAKNILREKLNSSSLGTITAAPSPLMKPYSSVVSLPACGDEVEGSIPLTYEVDSVVHYISAQRPNQGDRRRHETQMRVNLDISDEFITIDGPRYKEVTPNETSLWEDLKSNAQKVIDFTVPETDL